MANKKTKPAASRAQPSASRIKPAARTKKKSAAKKKIAGPRTSKPSAKPASAPARRFQKILATLSGREREVQAGRMMSSPGIVRNGKVFAFLWNDDMVFRLGKGFDPATLKVTNWRYLNPFKDKPPMKGWYVVPPLEMPRWERLAQAALEAMRNEQEK